MTLVDTNVLLDVATDDARWARWSVHQLDAANIRGPVLINSVVYAEFSIGYVRIEEADRVLADVGLKLIEIPRAALFLAGKVLRRYRAQGGSRTGGIAGFLYRRPRRGRTDPAAYARSAPLSDLLCRHQAYRAGRDRSALSLACLSTRRLDLARSFQEVGG